MQVAVGVVGQNSSLLPVLGPSRWRAAYSVDKSLQQASRLVFHHLDRRVFFVDVGAHDLATLHAEHDRLHKPHLSRGGVP